LRGVWGGEDTKEKSEKEDKSIIRRNGKKKKGTKGAARCAAFPSSVINANPGKTPERKKKKLGGREKMVNKNQKRRGIPER